MTAITVPAGMKSIKMCCCALAPDEADPAGVRFAPVFRLEGSGLGEQLPHHFFGPAGNIATKTTSGAFAFEGGVQKYDVDIPVKEGSTILPRVLTLDEAITAGTLSIALCFSDEAPKLKNSMSDYVDVAATTTAGAWYTIGTLTVPKTTEGKDPTVIRAISMILATDQATLALLRCASRFRLSGAGLKHSGPLEFLGPHSGTGCNTAGILGYSRQIEHLAVNIPVNAGGTILVEHYLTTETPTAGTAALLVMYGA
jgi:hypothetical protein